MKKVYKYAVPMYDTFELQLPIGAQILQFGTQDESDTPFIWALVDPTADFEDRFFRLAGTGHVIDDGYKDLVYVGTVFIFAKSLVFHLFELRQRYMKGTVPEGFSERLTQTDAHLGLPS